MAIDHKKRADKEDESENAAELFSTDDVIMVEEKVKPNLTPWRHHIGACFQWLGCWRKLFKKMATKCSWKDQPSYPSKNICLPLKGEEPMNITPKRKKWTGLKHPFCIFSPCILAKDWINFPFIPQIVKWFVLVKSFFLFFSFFPLFYLFVYSSLLTSSSISHLVSFLCPSFLLTKFSMLQK